MPFAAVVVGCGMMTSVGLSALEVAASARARVQRLGEIEIRDRRFRRFVVGSVPDDALPDADPADEFLPTRVARMVRLAEAPLKEALALAPKEVGPVPLFLGLPEQRSAIPIDGDDFLKRLARGKGIDPARSTTIAEGRASGLEALRLALEGFQEGKSRFCAVGGVDSQAHLHVLGTLDLQGRVRHVENPDGFAPSEGAAFLLLTTEAIAKKLKLVPLAGILACVSGFEKGHVYSEEPYLGDGLSETFTALFEAAGETPPVGCVYASFNGERYWGKEFGVAFLRNRDRFDPAHQMEHPAECFGDLGAAHGAALLGLACVGLSKGYRRAPVLVYSSSDYGRRAATVIDRAGAE